MTKLERWIGNEVTSVFNPKASVIENLTKKTMKKYVKWLCKCRYAVSTNDVRVCTSEMRSALAKGHRMSLNWLLNYHMVKKCKSKFFCRVKRPHTLLHNPEYTQDNKDGNVSKANKSIDEKKN